MSDRAIQDEVIRYLADARVRARRPAGLPIAAGEVSKAAHFSHFLARRYYRDRLARSFRYSHRLRAQTRRIAEEVVDGEDFDRFLSDCVMGSLESARRVGEMACAYLGAWPEPGPWWQELLAYELSYFLQAATSERGEVLDRPARGLSAACRQFAWAMPEMLSRLCAGGPIADDLRRETTLLFSRTRAGRIYVVEVEPQVGEVFRATNGHRTMSEIAEAAAVPPKEVGLMLASLADIGAVQLPL